MGKSTPSAPAVPNPVTTASAQGASNVATAAAQTAMNNANQNTPYGNVTYAPSGSYPVTQPDGSVSYIPTWTMQETLSDPQQRLLNQQQTLGIQANNAASLGLRTANQALASPVTAANLPALTTSLGATPTLATGYDQGGQIQGTYASGGQIQGSVDTAGITQARDDATNAALARLQPSMDQSNAQLQSQLANQGVGLGSSAYGSAMYNQAQANNDLRLGAVATGDAEQQAAYGQALSSGQFANAAQAQAEQQNAARAAFGNSAQGQQNAENAAQAAFGNTAASQDWQNRLQSATFGNTAREQSLSDQETINNNIINQISSLMHGGQVQGVPTANYSSGTLDQTPISSDTYASASLQNQQYMAQLQASAANTAAFGSALGGIMGGIGKMGSKSDRRLKSEVARIATARNGLPIYRYRLAGADGWHVGMMADEVALMHPDAVWTDPDDGWARVDYEKAVA